jgi:hypothetical protein
MTLSIYVLDELIFEMVTVIVYKYNMIGRENE